MAKDYNKVSMICRFTKDPETRFLHSGTAVASFSVANGNSFISNVEKKEETSFFNVEAFGKLAETITKYCKKGQQVLLEGRLKQESWEKDGKKQYAVKIMANEIQFLGSKSDNQQQANQQQGNNQNLSSNPFNDDDIPF